MTTEQAQILPAPPRPPSSGTIDATYMNQLVRWLEDLALRVEGTTFGNFSSIFLPPGGMPTTGYGLRAGEVFINDGILTVVQESDIWAGGFTLTSALGSVTVI